MSFLTWGQEYVRPARWRSCAFCATGLVTAREAEACDQHALTGRWSMSSVRARTQRRPTATVVAKRTSGLDWFMLICADLCLWYVRTVSLCQVRIVRLCYVRIFFVTVMH